MEILTLTSGRVHAVWPHEAWPGLVHVFSFKCGVSDEPHIVTVKLSTFLIDKWGLHNDDLKINKVLYETARKAIDKNPSVLEQTIELLSSNSPDKCPYES